MDLGLKPGCPDIYMTYQTKQTNKKRKPTHSLPPQTTPKYTIKYSTLDQTSNPSIKPYFHKHTTSTITIRVQQPQLTSVSTVHKDENYLLITSPS